MIVLSVNSISIFRLFLDYLFPSLRQLCEILFKPIGDMLFSGIAHTAYDDSLSLSEPSRTKAAERPESQ